MSLKPRKTIYNEFKGMSQEELLSTIQKLVTKVSSLEDQLEKIKTNRTTPSRSFQAYLKSIDLTRSVDIWESLNVLKNAKTEDSVMSMNGKLYVFDEYSSEWVLFKKINNECLEKLICAIQAKILCNLPKDDQYHVNIVKLTSMNIKRWVAKEKKRIEAIMKSL